MAPKLHIELSPGPFGGGETKDYYVARGTLEGVVRLEVPEPFECRSLTVSVGWHTEGRGDRDAENVWEEQVAGGAIEPGTYDFPFRVQLPKGPISYAGRFVTIVWKVEAHLDIPWRRDVHAEARFYVLAPEVEPVPESVT